MNNPHSSNNDYIACSSSGNIVDSKNFFVSPPDHKLAFLKHYATKTIEEYCLKIKKGRSDIKLLLNNETLIDRFNYFFLTNNKTIEKILYFNNIFNVTFK